MKNKSLYSGFCQLTVAVLTTGMLLVACDKEKDYTPAMPEALLINAISLEVGENLPMPVGMDSTLVYTIDAPAALEDRSILWTSSDEKVARVSQDGTVSAISTGSAVISVTPAIGFGATASVTVNVVPELITATSLKVSNPKEGQDIYETDEIQFTAEVLPVNRTYTYLTWGSSDESIATVDDNGLVTCLKAGDVTITAYTHDHSGVSGSYALHINEYIPVESLEIAPYDKPVCISMGDIVLDVTYTTSNSAMGSVTWTSSNTAVATVEKGVVTPVGFGSTTITATCQATEEMASVTINVESGWWIWNNENGFAGWSTSTANAKVDYVNDKMHVTMSTGSKYRADLKIKADNKSPFYMDLANYPVIAMRCDIPKGGNNTLDAKSVSGTAAGNPKCNAGIDLADGSRLIYYDIAALKKYDAGVVGFSLFQIKIADIPAANVTTGAYDVWWIRTFKSVDEMKTFAEAEVAEGK